MFRQSSLRRGVCWRHICIESSRWSMSTWSYCATSASLIVSESPRMRREIGHWQQREPTLKWLGPARCAVCLHCAASENQSFVTAAPRPGRRTPTIGMEQDTNTHTSRVSKLLVDAEHIQTRIQSSARVRRYNIDPTCRMHARTRRQTLLDTRYATGAHGRHSEHSFDGVQQLQRSVALGVHIVCAALL